MIYIMEDNAVPDAVFHGLFEAHVEEHCTVKRLCASLHREKKQKCAQALSSDFFLYFSNLLNHGQITNAFESNR